MATTYDRHIFKQLQDVLKKCDNLSQEIRDTQNKCEQKIYELKEEHKKEINVLNEKIDTLEKENTKLKEENKILMDDNTRMKSILNKNSTNSSIPPSKDEKPKKKKTNLREKTNKKTGGQKGHNGATFTKEDVEELLKKDNVKEKIIVHGDSKARNHVIKYEIDTETVVIVKKHIFYYNNKKELNLPKEFVSNVHYGENFKTLCDIMVVEEVISLERIRQFIEILTNGALKISEGSIVNWLKEKSKQCQQAIKELKIKIKNSEIIHTDLTETIVNSKKAYVRNYSTDKLTVYVASKDKKIHRVKRQWILSGYTGYIVQDHDTSLYNFGIRNKHVECNVHLRRYLKNNTELTGHDWSKMMDELLLEIKSKREKYLEEGIKSFSENEIKEYSKRYEEILEKGYKENKENNSKYLKQEEKAIIKRLKKYKENHLLYANDFNVPFDNNLSERDLRPIKPKKKVSGGHRNYRGLKAYCNIRSIISTCKKQKISKN